MYMYIYIYLSYYIHHKHPKTKKISDSYPSLAISRQEVLAIDISTINLLIIGFSHYPNVATIDIYTYDS